MSKIIQCKCGKDMEDWMSLCKECYGKQSESKPENRDRQESIERQVAAKVAGDIINGSTVKSTEQFDAYFDHVLKKIRGV